jgi:hypothetical protein
LLQPLSPLNGVLTIVEASAIEAQINLWFLVLATLASSQYYGSKTFCAAITIADSQTYNPLASISAGPSVRRFVTCAMAMGPAADKAFYNRHRCFVDDEQDGFAEQ